MMTAKFLHGEIREKGGAYGGGARMGGGGLFSFYSYRWASFSALKAKLHVMPQQVAYTDYSLNII